jgi:hypothetical protein
MVLLSLRWAVDDSVGSHLLLCGGRLGGGLVVGNSAMKLQVKCQDCHVKRCSCPIGIFSLVALPIFNRFAVCQASYLEPTQILLSVLEAVVKEHIHIIRNKFSFFFYINYL